MLTSKWLLLVHAIFSRTGKRIRTLRGHGNVEPGSGLSVGFWFIGWTDIEKVQVHGLEARPDNLHLVHSDQVPAFLAFIYVVPPADQLQLLQAELESLLVNGSNLGGHSKDVVC